eukprot:TRINITY_DN93_c0_g1_i3.p1 TRINITY_DN93_c0_g1~~TRINITY_DN93_c0_g1_i3.p1  ORF type:complete len:332 (+),score=188.86 TRINITY_DN93_c0_g1_i3:76-996(+)
MAVQQKKKIPLYSTEYYLTCGVGGIVACGLTHTGVVSLDIIKCRKQVGIKSSFSSIIKNEGSKALVLGWAPTLFGYSAQGFCKFGFYELFKKKYAGIVGEENAKKYQDLVYVSASASAELIADIALCPFEAVKVRIQCSDPAARTFPTTLREGLPKIYNAEGFAGLYKGLVPLWSRQVPYTIMKFWAFERTVQALYKHVVPKPRDQCSKLEQLGVSFGAGYIAGIFCATVSHPADVVVSKLNTYESKPPISQILKQVGPVGIWSGLGLRIIMVGTLTALQWGIYDAFKVYSGLPTTGAKTEEPKKN